MALRASPVQQEAERAGLAVRTPGRLKSAEEQERFRALDADAAVVVAYGLILPKPILDGTRLGAFNLACLAPAALARRRSHQPRHHGRRPGDRRLDHAARPKASIPARSAWRPRGAIGRDMTAGELHDALAASGAALMVTALEALERRRASTAVRSRRGRDLRAEDRSARDAHRLARPAP